MYKENIASLPFLSCENRHDSNTPLFLNTGTDSNLCSTQGFNPFAEVKGFTPLFSACLQGNDKTVKILIENGAEVNLCDSAGCSPLAVASEYRHVRTVQLLVQNNAKSYCCEL